MATFSCYQPVVVPSTATKVEPGLSRGYPSIERDVKITSAGPLKSQVKLEEEPASDVGTRIA
jgi:hypothetical protein